MNDRPPHHLAGPADRATLHDAHTLLSTVWAGAPHIRARERIRFTLIIAELIANIIEHGTIDRADPPHLELRIDVHDDAIRGTLTDNGAAPPSHADTPAHPVQRGTGSDATHLTGIEIAALRESGRGLLIVRSVADDLALTRAGDHNHWHFAVHRQTPAA